MDVSAHGVVQDALCIQGGRNERIDQRVVQGCRCRQ